MFILVVTGGLQIKIMMRYIIIKKAKMSKPGNLK